MSAADVAIRTFTSRLIYPFRDAPGDIRIVDIAHALSMQCRFNGHTREFYSVAEHCVRASEIVTKADALWALLHDAHEAYTGDVPTPIKAALMVKVNDIERWPLSQLESNLQTRIEDRFALGSHLPDSVKHADQVMLVTESRDLLHGEVSLPGITPLPERIQPWSQPLAKARFEARFHMLVDDGPS